MALTRPPHPNLAEAHRGEPGGNPIRTGPQPGPLQPGRTRPRRTRTPARPIPTRPNTTPPDPARLNPAKANMPRATPPDPDQAGANPDPPRPPNLDPTARNPPNSDLAAPGRRAPPDPGRTAARRVSGGRGSRPRGGCEGPASAGHGAHLGAPGARPVHRLGVDQQGGQEVAAPLCHPPAGDQGCGAQPDRHRRRRRHHTVEYGMVTTLVGEPLAGEGLLEDVESLVEAGLAALQLDTEGVELVGR